MTFGERRCVRGFFRSHIDRSGTTADVSDKPRGWLHHARCADSHEDRAFVQSGEDAIQVERHFAEPADVRTNPAAAVAPGNLGGWFVDISVAERGSAACVATAFEQFPASERERQPPFDDLLGGEGGQEQNVVVLTPVHQLVAHHGHYFALGEVLEALLQVVDFGLRCRPATGAQ